MAAGHTMVTRSLVRTSWISRKVYVQGFSSFKRGGHLPSPSQDISIALVTALNASMTVLV